MKHTPGPWTVRASKTTDTDAVGIIGDNGCLAECFSEIRERGEMAFSERDANARLIAAAPDMLEALANLENDDGKAMPPSAWKLVQDALAKARGET